MTKNHILAICLSIYTLTACKKTLPDEPLPVSSTSVNYPPGYVAPNPNLIANKIFIGTADGNINDVVMDATDNSKAYLLGSFYQIGQVSSKGVMKFSSSNKSFSAYPLNITNQDIRCFAQLNGNDYLGGSWYDYSVSGYRYFSNTPSGSSNLVYPNYPNGLVLAMQAYNNSIYFAGNFNSVSQQGTYSSPMVSYNGSSTSNYGTAYTSLYGIKKIVNYNSMWFASSTVAGYILNCSGSNWFINYDGGFNYLVNDLAVMNNTLYVAGYMTGSYSYQRTYNYVNYLSGNTWKSVGTNNLPGPCLDLEYNNGVLFAAGINSNGVGGYIYYLESANNSWRPYVKSSVQPTSPTKIIFINNKLYVVDGYSFYLFE